MPSPWTWPIVTGRRNVVLLDWPTAKLPRGPTATTVAHDAIVSASAA